MSCCEHAFINIYKVQLLQHCCYKLWRIKTCKEVNKSTPADIWLENSKKKTKKQKSHTTSV